MTTAPGAHATDGADRVGYDVATALWQGKRPYQEDTLLADFHGGLGRGFAVLADGMGGHAAGDLASRLVVIDAVSHLKFLMHDGAALEKNLSAELNSAIETANDVLRDRAAQDPHLHGMGATFLATIVFEDRLYWASVGDSPLYLWREGVLRQLNEDHSMAPIIDQMAKSGELTRDEAASHPDRNALTSVLMGGKVKAKDVPKTAMVLDPGDVLIQASDGLQYLDNEQISDVLAGVADGESSRGIADALMRALHDLDDPAQDNTAVLVLQLRGRAGAAGGGGAVAKANTAGDGAHTVESVATAEPEAHGATAGRRRRYLVPAVLIGGAALAVALAFGLPGDKDAPAPDVAQSQPAPEQVAQDPSPDLGTVGTELAPDTDATPVVDAAAVETAPPSDGLSTSIEEDAVEDTGVDDTGADDTGTDDTPLEDTASGAAPAERAVMPGAPGVISTKAGSSHHGERSKNFEEWQRVASHSSSKTGQSRP
jgi:serine/threonine protein phosphatase PrpC